MSQESVGKELPCAKCGDVWWDEKLTLSVLCPVEYYCLFCAQCTKIPRTKRTKHRNCEKYDGWICKWCKWALWGDEENKTPEEKQK
jgi:hypothetical protein